MIPQYINNWLQIIEQMHNDNTYKLAWGRAILECIQFDNCYADNKNENVYIDFDSIASCMLKYYWNQIFFFNLKQAPYKDKDPVIVKDTNKLIDKYKEITGSVIPVWFDQGKDILLKDKEYYESVVKHISKTLHENVSWRFLNVAKDTLDIYKLENSKVVIEYNMAVILKDYTIVLSKLLNYKWAQLLEKFNYQPKISSKVNSISLNKIRRNNLTKYKNELLKEFNGKAIDFYTGKEIPYNDISIDHVIPWSFMYSDDIWNLVITSKSNNSSKSNTIPSEEVIERLKERNKDLIKYVDKKYQDDILLSINNDLLTRLSYECRL